jgi:hypothetical protein
VTRQCFHQAGSKRLARDRYWNVRFSTQRETPVAEVGFATSLPLTRAALCQRVREEA